MKFIGIGGEPATGKSTLMQAFLRRLPSGSMTEFRFGKVRGRFYRSLDLYLIGVYDGKPFPGTDRLSMAVQPDFEALMAQCQAEHMSILFEGDRLFILKNFEKAEELGFQVTALFLEATKPALDQRHKDRGDNQSEQFLASRATKYRNLKASIKSAIVAKNETREDQDNCLNLLTDLMM